MEKETIYQIPPEGSLGLLALGHVGLQMWRKARLEYEEKTGKQFNSFYTKEQADNASSLLHPYINTKHES